MTTATIEINDAGIRAAIDGELVASSPGYAVLDGKTLLIGDEGLRNARLLPRWTNNRFWNLLNTDPVTNGTDTVRHHADLAFAHLEQVWQSLPGAEKVILAVPGFYSREQLGLLLGMARECGIPVAGLADTSTLAVAGEPAQRTVLHLDIFLHRITLTALNAETSLARTETVTVNETGLFTLWDRWANIIASQFIQTSRYDPMHQAVSEQKLYDALPDWIDGLAGARTSSFEMEIGTNRHQVAVSQEQLLTACAAIYPQIVQAIRQHVPAGEQASLFISDRFRGFPGLEDSLRLISNAEPMWLAEDCVATSAVEHASHIISSSGSLSHITSLPVSVARPDGGKATTSARPTHLLVGHHATPIGNALRIARIENGSVRTTNENPVCTLYTRGNETVLDNHAGTAISVNGAAAPANAPLRAGDVLRVNDTDIILISEG